MLFWAGLRGAVGVALAAGLTGPNGYALRATVLVVVVLTVIIFGGTTARMLEILEIRTGVVEEIDSDDEFDIEVVPHTNGLYKKGTGIGHTPRPSVTGAIGMNDVGASNGRPRGTSRTSRNGLYSTGSVAGSPPVRPGDSLGRRNSSRNKDRQKAAEEGLLWEPSGSLSDDDDASGLDLPPSARRSPLRENFPGLAEEESPYQDPPEAEQPDPTHMTARGAFSQLLNATTEEAGALFSRLDEGFIKPHLLLDPGGSRPHGQGGA